jgi:tRNA dimethylallyltransferase
LLYDRIDRRVAAMMDAGWRDECRRLLDGSHPPGREASQALGYRELFDDLRQPTRTTDELIALIQQKTRQFAKRQLTWFRGIAECRFLEMTHVTDDGVLDAFLSS